MLDLAARLAWRSAGYVEPNPMVGAVIVKGGRIIGMGHHRRFGCPHAEREALADCRARGEDPRGATLYVTLEPCRHHGKTPPCTEALIEAGIARVIAARRDPGAESGGGADVLRRAGIAVEFTGASENAVRLSDPFVKRVTTGVPWVIAKWAQFEDGRMVTRPGEPRWISNDAARRRVHRLRARVDAIVTGSGTVRADDPMLTVRGVRARRTPARVVLDPNLKTPPAAALVRTAPSVRTIIVCWEALAATAAAAELRRAGVRILPIAPSPAPGMAAGSSGFPVGAALADLARALNATNVLIEAGPTLLRALLGAALVDEAVVHVAPAALHAPLTGFERHRMAAPEPERSGLRLLRTRPLAGNVECIFRRTETGQPRRQP